MLILGSVGTYFVGVFMGMDLRYALIAGMWLTTIWGLVVVRRWERRIKEHLGNLSDAERSEFVESGGDLGVLDAYVRQERRDWHWFANSVLSGIYLVFFLPFVYVVWRGGLNWDAEFPLGGLVLMFAGLAAHALIWQWRFKRHACPICHGRTDRIGQRKGPLRRYCVACGVVWTLHR